MKQNESQGCLKSGYVLWPALWPLSGEDGYRVKGPKRQKISNKNSPRNHQCTVI